MKSTLLKRDVDRTTASRCKMHSIPSVKYTTCLFSQSIGHTVGGRSKQI